ARPATPATAAPIPNGLVRIAISPWGEVEVDGKPAGTSPPLTELSLPQGKHQIVIRNTDLPPHRVVVNVTADQPVTLKHKF
ncbi:MAG TPA: serine/threonine protein kinase, partial [Burkholderiaceae bacterium]